MQRTIHEPIITDLEKKIVLITGPRQCGKTTLAKLVNSEYDYLNYDNSSDRLSLKYQSWDREKPLIIFDELHKMKNWKRWLKGIYDSEGIPPQLLVTGSARLDVYRKVGDSLAGRYFQYRLHPIDLKEALRYAPEDPLLTFERLYTCSGFPEPFIKGDRKYYRRWQRTHTDIILKQDLPDLYATRDIKSIETLILLLKQRVGSTVSYANLARDLERDPNTIKRWLELLENMYIIFRVTPYSTKISRSILKEPKFYFYDFSCIPENESATVENIVACALLKELHYLEDTEGMNAQLHFLRNKNGNEIDFITTLDCKPTHIIEVKLSNDEPSKNFDVFSRQLPPIKKIQLVKNIKKEKTFPSGLKILSLVKWLSGFTLQ